MKFNIENQTEPTNSQGQQQQQQQQQDSSMQHYIHSNEMTRLHKHKAIKINNKAEQNSNDSSFTSLMKTLLLPPPQKKKSGASYTTLKSLL